MKQKHEKHVMIVENSVSTLKMNENTIKSTKLQLEGKFTEFDIENRNKRMYTADKFIPYMNSLLEKKKTLGVLYGEYDHPDVFDVTCKNLSHVIDNLTHNESGNCIDGSITLLNNSWGKEARSIIEDGYPLFVSSRAAGVTDANGMVQLKELFTYDIVADPGFSSARVTPKIMNESLGFRVTDDVPYRIYEMNDSQVNALFQDNKNDNQTQKDIMQFENFLQTKLAEFEAQLFEKLNGKNYAPEESKVLIEKIDVLKEEIAGVNKVLEFFRSKMNVLIKDNSKLRDENKKIQTEITENLFHANHLTNKVKSLTKYALQIDERLNSSEGLLEHVAKHTEANIYFSKDIANNLSITAKEVEATQGLLEHVATNVKENADALLFVINESEDVKGFVEDMAKEVEATQGLLEHTAKESAIDNMWLTYIHEKVDGVINYSNELVNTLKADNKKILKENVNNATELSKLDSIETYLGMDKEQELVTSLENETKIAAVSTKIAINEDENEEEPKGVQAIISDDTNTVQPIETPVQGDITTTDITNVGVQEVQPTNNTEITIPPVQGDDTTTTTTTTDVIAPVTIGDVNQVNEPTNDDSLETLFLNQLVKNLATDDTGIVIEITPDNKLIIQKSGTDETFEATQEEIEKLDINEDNIIETVTNLVGEINKHKALAVKEPHFFTMLSDKQIVEFKQLDQDTQAKIILMMNEKEYYSSNDVLNHIAAYINEKPMNIDERLISCIPTEIKEAWEALTDEVKGHILAESKYFPIKTEVDMINFWNTRSFAKKEETMIKENVNIIPENELDTFTNAFKGLN